VQNVLRQKEIERKKLKKSKEEKSNDLAGSKSSWMIKLVGRNKAHYFLLVQKQKQPPWCVA
jgi:hypothetical protein